jgi:hypothetical protein
MKRFAPCIYVAVSFNYDNLKYQTKTFVMVSVSVHYISDYNFFFPVSIEIFKDVIFALRQKDRKCG